MTKSAPPKSSTTQFLQYLTGGSLYFWSGYVIFAICYSGFGWWWLWSKVAADAVGCSLNYIVQRFWTFSNQRHLSEIQHLGRYLFIGTIGFILDYLIIAGLNAIGITPYIGFFISAAFFTVWSWLWYKYWVFSRKTGRDINIHMNEKQTSEQQTLRPTKKQRELLTFIENFIQEHGYSPSYREIMTGLSYTSVATVALHVNNLIKRGHLRKRDHSARSLELVTDNGPTKITTNKVAANEEKWLVEKVEHAFAQVENNESVLLENSLDNLYVLVGALKVLGLEGAAQSFMPRLNSLKQRQAA